MTTTHTKDIRILVATGLYPPDIGGPATYIRMLEEELPKRGIEIITVPFGRVRHLHKIVRHIAYVWLLLQEAKKADMIYALDSMSVGLPALLVSFVTRKKFLLRLGGDYAWEQGQQRFGLTQDLDAYTHTPKGVPLRVKVFAFIQSFVAKHAVHVVAPSEYLKSIIATWGVPPKKIKVIYSALFPLQVPQSKEELRKELGYEGQVIVSVGRLVPWKGFLELVDAFAQLQKDIPDLFLVIIGDGPLEEALQKKVSEYVLERKVRIAGKMDKETLGKAIKASDLFVLNTSYEGLSHQLLEVMDLAVPIVTTDVGGNPELITNEISGLLVPVQDTQALQEAIKRMLEHESLRTRMVQNARVRILNFSHDAVVTELVSFLKEDIMKKQ